MISSCPACKKQIDVPEAAIGKKVRCSGCQAVFVVEANVPAPPPPPVKKKKTTDAPKKATPPREQFDTLEEITEEPPAKPPKKKREPVPLDTLEEFTQEPEKKKEPTKKKSAAKSEPVVSGNPFAFDEEQSAKKKTGAKSEPVEAGNPFGFTDNQSGGAGDLDFSKPDTSQAGAERREFQKKVRWGVRLLRLASVLLIVEVVVGAPLALANLGPGIAGILLSIAISGCLLSASYSLRFGRRFYYVIFASILVILLSCGSGSWSLLVGFLAFTGRGNLLMYAALGVAAFFTFVYLGSGVWTMILLVRSDVREYFKS